MRISQLKSTKVNSFPQIQMPITRLNKLIISIRFTSIVCLTRKRRNLGSSKTVSLSCIPTGKTVLGCYISKQCNLAQLMLLLRCVERTIAIATCLFDRSLINSLHKKIMSTLYQRKIYLSLILFLDFNVKTIKMLRFQ